MNYVHNLTVSHRLRNNIIYLGIRVTTILVVRVLTKVCLSRVQKEEVCVSRLRGFEKPNDIKMKNRNKMEVDGRIKFLVRLYDFFVGYVELHPPILT